MEFVVSFTFYEHLGEVTERNSSLEFVKKLDLFSSRVTPVTCDSDCPLEYAQTVP